MCRCCVLLLLAFSSYGVCVCCELNCVEAGSARRAGWSPSSCAGQDELELVISSFCCQTEFLVSWVVVFLGGGSLVGTKKGAVHHHWGKKLFYLLFSCFPPSLFFPNKLIVRSNMESDEEDHNLKHKYCITHTTSNIRTTGLFRVGSRRHSDTQQWHALSTAHNRAPPPLICTCQEGGPST